ncbi:LysE family translocator [Yokenella regensburgei]|uniref:LysE family translocator n=1 Tax=Yokenella regensburgei TaxID=158877 RepID=UPI003F145BF3
MNVALLGAYVLSILTLLLTPGPVVLLVTGTAAVSGYGRAFLTSLGTNLASLVLIAAAMLMLSGVVTLHAGFLSVLGMAGSLFIGWSAIRTLRHPDTGGGEAPSADAVSGGFLRGFVTGVANPKDILFFVSFFPQFMGISRDFTTSIITLSLVWILFDFVVLTGYILAVKRFLTSGQGRRYSAGSALVLLLIAAGGVVWNLGGLRDILFM